jgi:hypothetical protein
MQVLYMHRNAPIPRLAQRLAALQPLLDTLLAKEPDDRHDNANEAAHAIREARANWLGETDHS